MLGADRQPEDPEVGAPPRPHAELVRMFSRIAAPEDQPRGAVGRIVPRVALLLLVVMFPQVIICLVPAFVYAKRPWSRCNAPPAPGDIACRSCGRPLAGGVLMAVLVLVLMFGFVVARVKVNDWLRVHVPGLFW